MGDVDRHIMASCEGDLFAVWWRDSSEHGRLWSPGADKGYNLILFTVEKYMLSNANNFMYIIPNLVPSLPFPNANLKKREKRRDRDSLHVQFFFLINFMVTRLHHTYNY